MEKIDLLLIMVMNTKHLKLHRGNNDLSSIYHNLVQQIPGISGLTYMAGKQVIKNIFLIFSFSNNGFHNICKPYSFHCKTLALG